MNKNLKFFVFFVLFSVLAIHCGDEKKPDDGSSKVVDINGNGNGSGSGQNNGQGTETKSQTEKSCGSQKQDCTKENIPENAKAICKDNKCGFDCEKGYHLNKTQDRCFADSDINSCTVKGINCATFNSDTGKGICDPKNGCSLKCDDGYHLHEGKCVSSGSAETCGEKSLNCNNGQTNPLPPAGYAVCREGKCTFACAKGFHPDKNKCESDDAQHSCGIKAVDCNKEKNSISYSTMQCVKGLCESICKRGYHKVSSSNNKTFSCKSDRTITSCSSTGIDCTKQKIPPYSDATCDGYKCAWSCKTGYVKSGSTCVKKVSIACKSNFDCKMGWCGRTKAGGTECKRYQAQGGSCGGYTLPYLLKKCDPSLTCFQTRYNIADAPGTCAVSAKIEDLVKSPTKFVNKYVALYPAYFMAGPPTCSKKKCTGLNICCNSCSSTEYLVGSPRATSSSAKVIAADTKGGYHNCIGNSCIKLQKCDYPLGKEYKILGFWRERQAMSLARKYYYFEIRVANQKPSTSRP